MRIHLAAAILGFGCTSTTPPDTVAASPFDTPVWFVPAPPGCVYQRFESRHPVTSLGSLSQCLEIPVIGGELFSLVYSDYVAPGAGGYFVGGLAGTTVRLTGEGLEVAVGPHREQYVAANGRFVARDGSDGSWFELSGADLVQISGATRVRYSAITGTFRAISVEILGGASGTTPIARLDLVRSITGDVTEIRDGFARGSRMTYDGDRLISITDLVSGTTTTIEWTDGLVDRITRTGTSGGPLVSSFTYSTHRRLVGLTLPELGEVVWDRPNGEQVAKTRYLNPAQTPSYEMTSLACIASDGSRRAGVIGQPYGGEQLPAITRIEQLLESDRSTATPTRRTTDLLGHYTEAYFDAQHRETKNVDHRGVGSLYAYAGTTARITSVRSAATNVSLFDATIATDAALAPRLLYASTRGLDGLEVTYSYDVAGRMQTMTSAGKTLQRTYTQTANGTRICEAIVGTALQTCTDLDGNGQATGIREGQHQVASATYENGRIATAGNALGDQNAFSYGGTHQLLTQIDHSTGAPADEFGHSAGGAPSFARSGQRGVDYALSEAGAIQNWRNFVGIASWLNAIERSSDLLTTSYFINGERQWTEQQFAAPPPPVLDCNPRTAREEK